MNKLDELYLAVIQKDSIGNIIDIIEKGIIAQEKIVTISL